MSSSTQTAIKVRAEIEAQIAALQEELARWQQEAEAAIHRQDWQSLAANNCTRIHERINALRWVLDGAPMHTLVDR
jgi:hypothetical protein